LVKIWNEKNAPYENKIRHTCLFTWNSNSHWTDFHEILYWAPLLKPAEQIQGSWLKLGKNTGHMLGRIFMIS
jgi:hypothetical protein